MVSIALTYYEAEWICFKEAKKLGNLWFQAWSSNQRSVCVCVSRTPKDVWEQHDLGLWLCETRWWLMMKHVILWIVCAFSSQIVSTQSRHPNTMYPWRPAKVVREIWSQSVHVPSFHFQHLFKHIGTVRIWAQSGYRSLVNTRCNHGLRITQHVIKCP